MRILINHISKGKVMYENVSKFETSNNSYLIVQPKKSYPKTRIEKEKIVSFSIEDIGMIIAENQ